MSFVLTSGAAQADRDGDDRIFQRATNIRSGEATVYVYRRRSGAGAGAQIGFDVNNAFTGALWAGRYQAVAVPAGAVTVIVRGVASFPFKCVTKEREWMERWFPTGRFALLYLGIYGGPKWETTFQAEAGKEYFVEVSNGLRANLRTEEAAMKHKLASLKRSRLENIYLSQDDAVKAGRVIEQECSENRLTDPYQSIRAPAGVRAVD